MKYWYMLHGIKIAHGIVVMKASENHANLILRYTGHHYVN